MTDASTRSRAIQRKLKDVEALPVSEEIELLDETSDEEEGADLASAQNSEEDA